MAKIFSLQNPLPNTHEHSVTYTVYADALGTEQIDEVTVPIALGNAAYENWTPPTLPFDAETIYYKATVTSTPKAGMTQIPETSRCVPCEPCAPVESGIVACPVKFTNVCFNDCATGKCLCVGANRYPFVIKDDEFTVIKDFNQEKNYVHQLFTAAGFNVIGYDATTGNHVVCGEGECPTLCLWQGNCTGETDTEKTTDLGIVKTLVDDMGKPIETIEDGGTGYFMLTVTNNGNAHEPNAQVIDLLDVSQVTYVSDDSGGTYDVSTGLWDVGALGVGQSKTLKIKVTFIGTEISNTAVVSGTNFDPIPDNNEDTLDIGGLGAIVSGYTTDGTNATTTGSPTTPDAGSYIKQISCDGGTTWTDSDEGCIDTPTGLDGSTPITCNYTGVALANGCVIAQESFEEVGCTGASERDEKVIPTPVINEVDNGDGTVTWTLNNTTPDTHPATDTSLFKVTINYDDGNGNTGTEAFDYLEGATPTNAALEALGVVFGADSITFPDGWITDIELSICHNYTDGTAPLEEVTPAIDDWGVMNACDCPNGATTTNSAVYTGSTGSVNPDTQTVTFDPAPTVTDPYDIDWGDGTIVTGVTGSQTHTYAASETGVKIIKTSGTLNGEPYLYDMAVNLPYANTATDKFLGVGFLGEGVNYNISCPSETADLQGRVRVFDGLTNFPVNDVTVSIDGGSPISYGNVSGTELDVNVPNTVGTHIVRIEVLLQSGEKLIKQYNVVITCT